MKYIVVFFMLLCISWSQVDSVFVSRTSRVKNVFVFTGVGGGHAHPFRFTSANWCKNELGPKNGWTVETSNDPALFTESYLKNFQVIWLNGTSRLDLAFNTAQESVIKNWYESGKVGIVMNHGSTETYRGWTWADEVLLGGTYEALATPQPFTILRDPEGETHEIMQGMEQIQIIDEVFGWDRNQRGDPDLTVLAVADESSYTGGGKMNGDHPLIWVHETSTNGRNYVSGIGHMDNFADYGGAAAEKYIKDQFERAIFWVGNYDSTFAPVGIKGRSYKINSVLIKNGLLDVVGELNHSIEIYDSKGNIHFKSKNKKIYDVSQLDKGIYWVKLQSKAYNSLSKIVLING